MKEEDRVDGEGGGGNNVREWTGLEFAGSQRVGVGGGRLVVTSSVVPQ